MTKILSVLFVSFVLLLGVPTELGQATCETRQCFVDQMAANQVKFKPITVQSIYGPVVIYVTDYSAIISEP
jgi:hypothetical protein